MSTIEGHAGDTGGREHPDVDLLLSRIIDGEAGTADWSSFKLLAEREPSLWRELAEAQRQQADLAAEVACAVSVADAVDVPFHEHASVQLRERFRLVGTWGGWAVAAMVALAWTAGLIGPSGQPGPSDNRASLLPTSFGSPADALRYYVDEGQKQGQVVGEVPAKVLLNSRRQATGEGFEVIYVRQIVERAVVDDLYRFGSDELGQPVPVPVEFTPARPGHPG